METKLNQKQYDIAVIGSGPGGQKAAVQAAKKGKRVVVIDRRECKVGGVSLHSGTIPSKTLREAVLYLRGLRRKKIYGQSRRFTDKISLQDLLERVNTILAYELRLIESQFKRNGIDIIYGQASFKDSHNLEVENRQGDKIAELAVDKVILATGTIPRRPADVPFDYKTIFDRNFIFSSRSQLDLLPKSLIVYGAGVIGSEYAGMFAALGCEVTLMDDHKMLFPYIDQDIVRVLREHLEKMGVIIKMGQKAKAFSVVTAEGKKKGRIETEDGSIVEADAILFSKGRLPCVEPLKLENAGVECGERNVIKVDDHYRTTAENIYACGDVIGFPALASTSAEQGRVAARCAVGAHIKHHKPELFPTALYTVPEISTIGKTEEQLIKEKVPYVTGIAYFYEIAKAAIAGDDTGALKLLFHPETRKILGVHIIGEQAAEIVHIGQLVMSFGGTVDSFIYNVFNYPTWAEAYKIAALNGMNKLKEKQSAAAPPRGVG
ncbi:MAG: Si-specific NAD(P)(+) transhydrogenase [bacterium]|nr:Si-specific NAD(P)(+) transhydrogenase [bacterium]